MTAPRLKLHSRLHPIAVLLVSCAIGIATAGCDDEEEATPAPSAEQAGPPAMGFQVDGSLLAPAATFEEFDTAVRPPLGWEALPEAQLSAFASAVMPGSTTQPAEPSAEPLAVFVGPQDDAGRPMALIVSSVDTATAGRTEVAMREAFDEVKAGDFRVGTVPVRLLNAVPPGLVLYKVLVRPESPVAGRVLQLDYVAPMAGYGRAARAIESSIGSIRGAGGATAGEGGD